MTIFGAKVPLRHGWNEVSGTLRWLASRWSNGTDHRFEVVAAGVSDDLAYVVGFEHIANSVNGVPVDPYSLRVAHIYRRENDEWKIAHRHADCVPIDQTLIAKLEFPTAYMPSGPGRRHGAGLRGGSVHKCSSVSGHCAVGCHPNCHSGYRYCTGLAFSLRRLEAGVQRCPRRIDRAHVVLATSRGA